MDIEQLFTTIVDCSVEVRKNLGFGFLESVYQNALLYELGSRGVPCEKEKILDVRYKGEAVGVYRADIVVDNRIIIECKVADGISRGHELQLVNYLRATGIEHGIIIKFGPDRMEWKRKFLTYSPS